MPTPKLSRKEGLRRIEAIEAALAEGASPLGVPSPPGQYGALKVASQRLGLHGTLGASSVARIEAAAGRAINWDMWSGRTTVIDRPMEPRFDAPAIPHDDIPVDKLIEQLEERFTRRAEHSAAKKWMRFNLKDPGPACVVFVGDPHLDDNGCNWPLLKRDVQLMQTPNVHGVMLGDVTNNWAGKLQRLYAHQDVTRDRAWRLAEWYWKAIPWMLLIKGNHDIWAQSHGQGDPLDWMARGSAALEDWQARIEIGIGDRAFRIWAAHDFKGSSIWNPLHGPMRAARFADGTADIMVAGHQHHWQIYQDEDADKSSKPLWVCRARGYKYLDPHADKLQYASQQHGAVIAAVIDPSRDGPAAIQCYASLEEAIDILKFKRQRWEADHAKAKARRRR